MPPVTWKNVGTVSGAGALAVAARSGQQVGKGIAGVGKALSGYGDELVDQQTDEATALLMAANDPEEMQVAQQGILDSGVRVNSDKLNKVIAQKQSMTNEQTRIELSQQANNRADTAAKATETQRTITNKLAQDRFDLSNKEFNAKHGWMDKLSGGQGSTDLQTSPGQSSTGLGAHPDIAVLNTAAVHSKEASAMLDRVIESEIQQFSPEQTGSPAEIYKAGRELIEGMPVGLGKKYFKSFMEMNGVGDIKTEGAAVVRTDQLQTAANEQVLDNLVSDVNTGGAKSTQELQNFVSSIKESNPTLNVRKISTKIAEPIINAATSEFNAAHGKDLELAQYDIDNITNALKTAPLGEMSQRQIDEQFGQFGNIQNIMTRLAEASNSVATQFEFNSNLEGRLDKRMKDGQYGKLVESYEKLTTVMGKRKTDRIELRDETRTAREKTYQDANSPGFIQTKMGTTDKKWSGEFDQANNIMDEIVNDYPFLAGNDKGRAGLRNTAFTKALKASEGTIGESITDWNGKSDDASIEQALKKALFSEYNSAVTDGMFGGDDFKTAEEFAESYSQREKAAEAEKKATEADESKKPKSSVDDARTALSDYRDILKERPPGDIVWNKGVPSKRLNPEENKKYVELRDALKSSKKKSDQDEY